MVSRLANDSYLFDDNTPVDALVTTATRLWTNALGLTMPTYR